MYAWQFMKALAISDRHGWARFDSMQNHYNLVYREEEREMIPLCIDQGVGVIPWSPLARGFLAGNRTKERGGATTRSKSDEFAHTMYYQDDDFAIVDRLRIVAGQAGCTLPQAALAWMLSRPGLTAPIVGASRPEHLDQAIDAVSIHLTPEQVKSVEEPYRPHRVMGHIGPGRQDQSSTRITANRFTSTSPMSDSRSSGITTSPRRLSCMLGLFSVQPHSRNPRRTLAAATATSEAGRSDIRPAIGSATLPITFPSCTTTWPPPQAATSFTAIAICPSSVPATRRLWQSWATVVAIAHFPLNPNPCTNPTCTLPVPLVTVEVCQFCDVSPGVGADFPGLNPHLHYEVFGRGLVLLHPDDMSGRLGAGAERIEPEVCRNQGPWEVHCLL